MRIEINIADNSPCAIALLEFLDTRCIKFDAYMDTTRVSTRPIQDDCIDNRQYTLLQEFIMDRKPAGWMSRLGIDNI